MKAEKDSQIAQARAEQMRQQNVLQAQRMAAANQV